ncbi:Phosphocarrier protein HPr [compost metagenome]
MVKKEVVVNSENGIHARPASEIAKLATQYKCDIYILVDGKNINAKSPLMIMSAGIKGNSVLEIQCDGENEEEALNKLIELFETNFGK